MLGYALTRTADVLTNAGMVLGFFLAFIFLTNKNRQRRSHRILAVLLVILSFNIAHSVFIASQIQSPDRIKAPFILVLGPLLLFYFRELVGLQPLSRKDLVHFIPLAIYFAIVVPSIFSDPTSFYGAFFKSNALAISVSVWTLSLIQYGFYWWRVVHLYRRHLSVVESEFSSTEGKTLSWMKSFFHIFGVSLSILIVTIPIALHSDDYSLVSKIINVTLSLTIFFLGYEGLFQEEVFSNRDANPSKLTDDVPGPDPADSQKASEEAKMLVPKVLSYMDEKRPYLNDALTLTELARQIGMTRNQLSLVINAGVGESFYTFINKYRVEEAKRLIANPQNASFTILALAFEAGFPSKSSFHNIFKKSTGLTPTEYRHNLKVP